MSGMAYVKISHYTSIINNFYAVSFIMSNAKIPASTFGRQVPAGRQISNKIQNIK